MTASDADDELNAVPVVEGEARLKLDSVLRGRITPGPDSGAWPGAWSGGMVVPIAAEDLPVPRLVKWVLHDFVGGPDTGQDEKLAWQIRCRFDGRPFALAHQKFGLRLYVDTAGLEEGGAVVLANQVIAIIRKATHVAATSIFRPFAEAQVMVGRVTVSNQYHRLRRMYEHFRAAAENPMASDDEDVGEGLIAPHWNRMVRVEEQRFFNGVAMVNAFFSLLEHTLVLVWPFVNYAPEQDDLESFVGDRWTDKFRAVFDIPSSPEAKRLYDELRDVAEEYRNTYAHGGFDKERGSFLVHAPGGPVPAKLSDIRERRLFEFFPIPEPRLAIITDLFDRTDTWLRAGPAGYGIKYVESGYDVPFNKNSVNDYRKAMASDDAFDQYLWRLGEMIDRMMNMDY